MKLPITGALLAAALAPTALAADSEVHEAEARVYRNWKFELPSESFTRLSGGFTVGGRTFAVRPKGAGLEVDVDGDGQLDRVIEGDENEDTGVRTAYVTLEASGADGTKGTIGAVRLIDEGKGWHWATSSTMLTKVGGTKVQLIDQNNDGRFNEVGVDAIAVGSSKVACYLSEALHIGGELHELLVSADGKRLELGAFEGPTGVLDARSDFATDGKLLAAIVQSKDRRYSFDLARFAEGVRVPVGSYEVKSGKIGLGKHAVSVTQGDADYVDVVADEETTFAWGGPVRAEFAYHRRGAELLIRPDEVWYYGEAGEQYGAWFPVGKSPEFTVKEVKAGTELAKALFPGSC